jgi:SWI/SNF-related matrix-associated actin-dependent regulator 1 of chromatin subfamily A
MTLPKGPRAPELFPGQVDSIEAVLHGLRHGAVAGTGTARGVLLADEMGLGKSAISIVAANAIGFGRILIVCRETLRSVWEREIRTWQSLKHPIYHLSADNIGLYRDDFLARLRCGWVICNYSIVHRWPGLKDAPWALLICDEVTALKSHNARCTTAVFGGKYAGKWVAPIEAHKYLVLSGTPIPNRLEELATVLETLDPITWDHAVDKLVAEFFEPGATIDHNRRVSGEPKNLPILQHRLRQTLMVRHLKEDVLQDLPPQSREFVPVPLPPDSVLGRECHKLHQQRTILLSTMEQAKKRRRFRKAEELHERLQGLQAYMAHLGGANSYKIDAVMAYLLAQTEKVIVFAYHRDLIDEYVTRLEQAGRKVVCLTGANSKQSKRIVERFETDPEVQYFIGNFKVASQGITLNAASLLVFAELRWTPEEIDQASARPHRIGQDKPVRIIYFVLEDSLDPTLVAALERKSETARQALNPWPKQKNVKHQPRRPSRRPNQSSRPAIRKPRPPATCGLQPRLLMLTRPGSTITCSTKPHAFVTETMTACSGSIGSACWGCCATTAPTPSSCTTRGCAR